MAMLRVFALITMVATLCGCYTFEPLADLDLSEVEAMEEIRHKSAAVAALPPGALAKLGRYRVDGSVGGYTVGTVLKATPDGVALINGKTCIHDRDEDPPKFVRHPLVWIPSEGIATTEVLAPPRADFVASNIEIDPRRGQFEPIGVDFDY